MLQDEQKFRNTIKNYVEYFSKNPAAASAGWEEFCSDLFVDMKDLKPKNEEDGVDDLPEDDTDEK